MSSKVRWMDAFPKRWPWFPSKRLFPESKKRASVDAEQLSATQDYGVIPQKEFIRLAGRSVVQLHQHLDKRKHVEVDDFVISMRSFQGGLERAWSGGGIRSSYVVIKPTENVHVGYFSRLFKSSDYIQALQATANFIRDGQDLNYQNFRLIDLALPPMDEQKQIAAFLDYETAKIDALIEKQQQLIALLGEKRQAVISHAVTKGLNPDAPMRDSGIQWLGEVPEHWTLKRLKHISPKVGVGLVINPSTYTREEGVYFIFGGDVKEHRFDLRNTRRISPEDSDRLLPSRLNANDLVSVRVGEPGITAVVPPELEGANCASILVIRRGPSNSHWLCSAMNSWVGRQQVGLVAYGAAQKQFNVSDAVEFVFPVPPTDEQAEIAEFIATKLSRFDLLTQRAESAVELLQERRTALISAAVTGKIDVRGWKPPSSGAKQETEMEVA